MTDTRTDSGAVEPLIAEQKLKLEVKELRKNLEDADKPVWQKRGFALALIPILATFIISMVSLGYEVFSQHFSEAAEVKLSTAQLEQLQLPLTAENLELRNEKLKLEIGEKQSIKETVTAEIEALNQTNANVNNELNTVRASLQSAQTKLAETESELRGVGERIAIAKASGVELGAELDRLDVDAELKKRIMDHFQQVFGEDSVLSATDSAVKDERFRQLLAGTYWVFDDPAFTELLINSLAEIRDDQLLRRGRPLTAEILFAADGYALMRTRTHVEGLPAPVIISSVDGFWELSDGVVRIELFPESIEYTDTAIEMQLAVKDISFGYVPRLARFLAGAPGGVSEDFRPAHASASIGRAPSSLGNVELIRRSLFDQR